MAFSLWAWLGRGPAMCDVLWVGVRGGEQFAWAAFRGRGEWAWVFWGVRWCGVVNNKQSESAVKSNNSTLRQGTLQSGISASFLLHAVPA